MSPINSEEYKSGVGLKNVYVAKVLADTLAAYTPDVNEYLAPVASVSAKPTVNAKVQYADDQAFDAMSSEAETVLELEITNMPIEMLAKITGKVFDSTTGRLYDNGGEAPYFALSFQSLRSNGKYRFFQFLKGRFSTPGEEAATKAESPDPKTIKLTYTAIKTVHPFVLSGSITDGAKRVVGDEDTASFSGTGWFTSVQIPGVATPSALALSSSTPTGGATGISKTANLVLTFNNMLASGAENNVILLDATNTVVACTNSIDSTRKIITIDPTPSLAGTAAHSLGYAVMDIYGQKLTGVVKFTTAA
jgi:phi13 family phage major tail protein